VTVATHVEPARDPETDSIVPSIAFRHATKPDGQLRLGGRYRIYEVNWSPDTRVPLATSSMAYWVLVLLATVLRPTPRDWLRWPRLRAARLRLVDAEHRGNRPAKAFVALATAYRLFRGSLGERWRASNDLGSGFAGFAAFSRSGKARAVAPADLEASLTAWRDARLPCEGSTREAGRAAAASIGVFVMLVAACVSLVISDASAAVLTVFRIPTLLLLLAVAVPVSALFWKFVTAVLSDVRYWSALSENDGHHAARMAVLSRTAATIRHIVADRACERLVIVSHSLGTAIAFDALRTIGLHNRAAGAGASSAVRIGKLDLLVTLGSPIDKLALLFETSKRGSFREELIEEDLRGDLAGLPFSKANGGKVRWLNFWDADDPVADALFTPLGVRTFGEEFEGSAIENVEVVNTRLFDPVGSHTAYLSNVAIAGRILDEVIGRQGASARQDGAGAPIRDHNRVASRWLVRTFLAGFGGLLTTLAFLPVVPGGLSRIGTIIATVALIGGGLGVLALQLASKPLRLGPAFARISGATGGRDGV